MKICKCGRKKSKLKRKKFVKRETRVSEKNKKETNSHLNNRIFKMEFIKPNELVLEGNLAENWRRFKQNYHLFEIASGLQERPDPVRLATFLTVIGENAREIYNGFNISEEQRINLEAVVTAFENYCVPRTRIVYERFVFFTRSQQEREPFENFYLDLIKLSKSCEFGYQTESLIRDRIVLGIFDKRLQKKMLEDMDLPLQRAAEMCRASEISEVQSKKVQEHGASVVHTIQDKYKGLNKNQNSLNNNVSNSSFKNNSTHFANKWNNKSKHNSKGNVNNRSVDIGKNGSNKNQIYHCKKCNTKHKFAECPAFNKRCNNCNGLGHFAIVCKIQNVRNIENMPDDMQSLTIHSVNFCFEKNKESNLKRNSEKSNIRSWTEKIRLKDSFVEFKLDTGSQVNILSIDLVRKVDKNIEIKPTHLLLEAYGGQKIKPLGVCEIVTMYRNEITVEEFVVIEDKLIPILGLNSCINLELISKIDTINKSKSVILSKENFIKINKSVFEGMGCFPQKCKIEIKSDAIPVASPPRRVPLKIHDELERTLKDLEKYGIIKKVDSPRDWVHNLVVIEKKNGRLRVCLDPRVLNKSIKRCQFPIPTMDEIAIKVKNKKFFSVFDLKDGFWQVELDENSSHLCSFSTPFGVYEFLRLPFGVMSAPEHFQSENVENFGDIENLTIYFDDFLIAAETEEEHDIAVKKLMERAKKLNIKFNPEKVQYRLPEVEYFGHKFSALGISPLDDRILAIKSLKNPTNKKTLQKFLGVVNYMRNFIPNLSEETAPLRELLKSHVIFSWTEAHSKCVQKIKDLIAETTVLTPFDDKKQIVIQTDASRDGLGCCLLQDNKPVIFSSRSLSDTEKRYSQIEKELLAITFACKKYHFYIYGRSNVIIKSDHKPLIPLVEKEIHKIPSSKLQRMRITLLKYDLKLEYIPGKFLYLADYLSRDFLETKNEEEDKTFIETVLSLDISDQKLEIFKTETLKDPVLGNLIEFCLNGWPKDKTKLKDDLKYYFKFRNEIFLENGVLFYNERIMVPKSLKIDMLNQLHESHMGINKTKARAAEIFYWLSMGRDIENLVSKCEKCEKYRNSNVKEPMMTHEIPELPFEKIGCDIFEYAKKSYLIIVDYHSKWIEFKLMKNKTSSEVIKHWTEIFARLGVPRVVIADNVPFNSFECKKFSERFCFDIITSSPNYAQSNGQAERAVQIAKNIIKKSDNEEQVLVSLMEYRNTPLRDINLSPAQLLMNRRLRTKLPISYSLLKPKLNVLVHEKLVEKSLKNKRFYDQKGVRTRDDLNTGDKVLIQSNKNNNWNQGIIVDIDKTPRSYIVEEENGGQYRRNRYFLRKRK